MKRAFTAEQAAATILESDEDYVLSNESESDGESAQEENSEQLQVDSDSDETDSSDNDHIYNTSETRSTYIDKNGEELFSSRPVNSQGRNRAQDVLRHQGGPTRYAVQRIQSLEDSLVNHIR